MTPSDAINAGFCRPLRLTHIGRAVRDVEAVEAALRAQVVEEDIRFNITLDPPLSFKERIGFVFVALVVGMIGAILAIGSL